MVCCVVDCANKNNLKTRCFPFPRTNYKSNKLVDLALKRRNAWIHSLRISSPDDGVLYYQRVCFLHFIKGCPAKLSDKKNPDWIPNQLLGVGVNTVCEIAQKHKSRENVSGDEALEISDSESFGGENGGDYDEPDIEFVPVTTAMELDITTNNSQQCKSKNTTVLFNEKENLIRRLEDEGIYGDNNDFVGEEEELLKHMSEGIAGQTNLALEELQREVKKKQNIIKMYEKEKREFEVKYRAVINKYEVKIREHDLEMKRIKAKFRHLDVSIAGLKNDDEKVKNLTGLPNFNLLSKLYEVVKNDLNHNPKIGISKFESFIITLMKLRLDLPISYLSHIFGESNFVISKMYRENLAIMNRKIGPLVKWPDDETLLLNTPRCFKDIMGDKCIVLIHFLEISVKNLKPMRGIQTLKHKIRYLIAFTPAGEIIYVSQGFGTSASNEGIIEESGFFDKISENHIVLSVKDMFEENQKDNEQIQSIKHMAKNTEDKVLDILKDNFRILFNRQPVNLNGEIYSEYTVRCCCALANLQMPELMIDHIQESPETVVVHSSQISTTTATTEIIEIDENEDEM